MTQLQHPHQQVQMLIPDLLPLDHVSLNTKRLRFIKGQGVLIYDDTYVVEIYTPYSRTDDLEFFGVQRHHGKIENMRTYYQRLPILKYDDVRVNSSMKAMFDEAMFHYLPTGQIPSLRQMAQNDKQAAVEVFMHSPRHEELSGAA